MTLVRNARRVVREWLVGNGTRRQGAEELVFQKASTERAILNAIQRGVQVRTVIDVGASNGSWSRVLMKHLPLARYLLVEAQECHKAALEEFCAGRPNASYFMTAAGDRDGFCYFDDGSPFGGLAAHEPGNGCVTQMPMARLDTLVEFVQAPGPFLLKLDTHGFELPILEGADKVLQKTDLVVIEAYAFRLNPTAPLFHELCNEMYQRGFQCVDFSEPMWRPRDKALWQWDLFFQRKDCGLLSDSSYA